MQFVEANSFEVSAAVHELERPSEPLRFALFPMVQIGERAYYDDIAERAGRCDLLLVEGVPSIWARIASRSYALVASRLGLVAKLILPLFLPIYGVCFQFTGSRERLAKQLEVTDSPLREWILSATDETDALDDLVMGRRDREFVDRLRATFEELRGKPATIGILYGAAHLLAIFRFLSERLGYRVKASSSARVFSLV